MSHSMKRWQVLFGITSFAYLRAVIQPVPREIYVLFETEARTRMGGRDQNDWPVLASALALACDLWTEDTDFFGVGVAVWNTERIEILLKRLASPAETFDE